INVDDTVSQQSIHQALHLNKPLFVQFNATGMGYGVWPVDTGMLPQLFHLDDYVSRASAYITLYENMLNGRYLQADSLLKLFTSGLPKETVELNLRLLTNYIGSINWEFISDTVRKRFSNQLEQE